jgi:TRAP-type mannitol/chloroaromatic compound transport system permease large subunit
MIEGQLALAMFVVVCGILLLGFPVALTLGGHRLRFRGARDCIGAF